MERKRQKDWRTLHRHNIAVNARRYYVKNHDAIKERLSRPERKAKRAAEAKKYQQTPGYKILRRKMYQRNAESIKAKARAFGKSPNGRKWAREYQSRRRRENPYYHFLNWLHGSINRCLRSQAATKAGRTEELIGCTRAELRAHLESQFGSEFTWENRSSVWDVDHFIPVSKFLLADPEEQRWASNWRNLRPLARKANQSKSDTLPEPLPSWLPSHIAMRVEGRAGGL